MDTQEAKPYQLKAQLALMEGVALKSALDLANQQARQVGMLEQQLTQAKADLKAITAKRDAVWREIQRIHRLHPDAPIDAYRMDGDDNLELMKPELAMRGTPPPPEAKGKEEEPGGPEETKD